MLNLYRELVKKFPNYKFGYDDGPTILTAQQAIPGRPLSKAIFRRVEPDRSNQYYADHFLDMIKESREIKTPAKQNGSTVSPERNHILPLDDAKDSQAT